MAIRKEHAIASDICFKCHENMAQNLSVSLDDSNTDAQPGLHPAALSIRPRGRSAGEPQGVVEHFLSKPIPLPRVLQLGLRGLYRLGTWQ